WEEAHVTGNLTIAYPRSTSRRRKQHGRTGNHSSTSEQRGQATWKNRNHVSPRKPIQHSKVASTAPRAEGHAEAEHAYRAPCHLERVASSSVSSSPFRFPDSQCARQWIENKKAGEFDLDLANSISKACCALHGFLSSFARCVSSVLSYEITFHSTGYCRQIASPCFVILIDKLVVSVTETFVDGLLSSLQTWLNA
ncbi:hypothetical protein BHM03_00057572, partial [Ensete ventricosum]